MIFEELEKALSDAVLSMPISQLSDNPPVFNETYLGGTNEDHDIWRELITNALKTAKIFEIHCWEDEYKAIEIALKYGKRHPTDWNHGVVIGGEVTDEFKTMLLTSPKPQNNEMGNRLTIFFNIFLDDFFQSCHYGTEIFVK